MQLVFKLANHFHVRCTVERMIGRVLAEIERVANVSYYSYNIVLNRVA